MSRHPLAERDELLEMLCMPLADPLYGRLDGTAWVRRALEAAGIVIDERDADAFIKRAHMDLDPSDAENAVEEEWDAELEAAGVKRQPPPITPTPKPSTPGGNWIVEAIERHRSTLTPEQLAVEDATGMAEREIYGPGPLATSVVALMSRMAVAGQEHADGAALEFLTLVLDEGFALQMDRYVLALLIWSEGGQRPHGYGDDGTGPGWLPDDPRRPRRPLPGGAPSVLANV